MALPTSPQGDVPFHWPQTHSHPTAAASLTVTSKSTLTLHKELLPGGRLELHAERATAEISGFMGLLAGRTRKTASLEELTDAAAAGWADQ
jgi:hypothetical protein